MLVSEEMDYGLLKIGHMLKNKQRWLNFFMIVAFDFN